MVRYGQLLLIRGRDYISRFKPVKRGTCFISVTCARSIFGAWAHRNRHAGTKIAFNSPVWELYSIPLSCNKDGDRRRTLCKKWLASPTHGSPSGRVGRRQVWEKGERWRSGGVEVDKMCSITSVRCALFEKPFTKYYKKADYLHIVTWITFPLNANGWYWNKGRLFSI